MANKNQDKKGTKRSPSISPIHRPANMTPEQWQRALRRQAAEKEPFGIHNPGGQDYPFVVTNARSGRSYKAYYYGPCSPLNRCECMDFKTNRLGTCKHIEAISLTQNGRFARKHYPKPLHTTVYVDYTDGRKIKIREGQDISPELKALAQTLFNKEGEIKDYNCEPSDFIRKAKQIDETFEWEADALDILIDERAKIRRKEIIARDNTSSLFDGLIKTTLHPYQADGVRFALREDVRLTLMRWVSVRLCRQLPRLSCSNAKVS